MFLLKSSAIALALVVGASTLAVAKSRDQVRHVRAHKAPVFGSAYPYRSYNGYYANSYRARNFQDTIKAY